MDADHRPTQLADLAPVSPGKILPSNANHHAAQSEALSQIRSSPQTPTQMGSHTQASMQTSNAGSVPAVQVRERLRFASPPATSDPSDAAFIQECENLCAEILRRKPEVARRVVRQLWETALAGSDYHSAFVLSVPFQAASPDVLRKTVSDFGRKMVKASKKEIVAHLNTTDLDEMSSLILDKASNNFLDQALKKRLETIPAPQLVIALASADRLGYTAEDIVRADPNFKRESVVPATLQGHVTASNNMTSSIDKMPGSIEQARALGIFFCEKCSRPCSGSDALSYHLKKQCCNTTSFRPHRLNKDVCVHCGFDFRGSRGLQYHSTKQVCGKYSNEMASIMLRLLRTGEEHRRHELPSLQSQVQRASEPPAESLPAAYAEPENHREQSAYTSLPAEQRLRLIQELEEAEEKYQTEVSLANQLPHAERAMEMRSLRNVYTTRKSLIRKRFGVNLRNKSSTPWLQPTSAAIRTVSPAINSEKQSMKSVYSDSVSPLAQGQSIARFHVAQPATAGTSAQGLKSDYDSNSALEPMQIYSSSEEGGD